MARGREEAAARIAAIMDAPAPVDVAEPAGPPVGSPQWQAARMAGRLLAQSNALDVVRAREQPTIQDYDPEADERRRWALQRATMAEPAVRYGESQGGAEVLPNGVIALVTRAKDGSIERLSPAIVAFETIGPADWDRREAEWQSRQRVGENELLARHYGADRCVAEGFFTEQERAGLDPVRSRHVPLPRGLEAL